jgi:hypothetical protein
MAALVDALPPVMMPAGPATQVFQGPAGAIVLSAAILDRCVGDYKMADGTIVTVRRYGTLLTAKRGTDPEIVIYAFSETRFAVGPNFIEFQRDSAGAATGLVLEQGRQKFPGSRIR